MESLTLSEALSRARALLADEDGVAAAAVQSHQAGRSVGDQQQRRQQSRGLPKCYRCGEDGHCSRVQADNLFQMLKDGS